jgi:sRNA-binding regulator protein Hfq
MDDAYNTIGQNSEFNATIKVENGSSINDIATEKDHVTVYNINGVKVIDNQPASELNKLKKGIYIINGKKYIKQ